MSAEIKFLEDKLTLRKLEAKLGPAKEKAQADFKNGKGDGRAPVKLRNEVREARKVFRTKYPFGGTVNPGTVNMTGGSN